MSDTGALIYVVDDDASVREAVGSLIRSAGYRAETFGSAQEFLAAPRTGVPSCLVLDVELPGLSGLDLQQELAKSKNRIPIIFLTGHGDIPMTVQAIKAGALEFLTKPFDDEDLLDAIRKGIASYRASRQPGGNLAQHSGEGKDLCLEEEVRTGEDFEGIVGQSPTLRDALDLIETVAPSDSTVLLLGETGTGKELFARAIHERSRRKDRALVKLNCAAIPTGLLESELFGHERGAFTGAIAQKIGRVELADKGTLFLDEVGDIPLELQPKLLRVLQEQEFERLGGVRTIRVDARLVVATNRDLDKMVAQREFRQDLFYRLNIFPIRVPPLRERAGDIPLLVEFFVNKHAKRMGRRIERIPAETMRALSRWHWPGNVRELENVIERALILSLGPVLEVPLAQMTGGGPTPPSTKVQTLEDSQKEIILRALHDANGVIANAAGKLGMKRTTLNSKMRKLHVSRSDLFSASSL
jgi:DNA-binding NtrC family response regulator